MNAGTKPYSETDGKADPGMYLYESEPTVKPLMRIIPGKHKNDIIMLNSLALNDEDTNIIHTDYTEGMSSLNPMYYESNMDAMTSFYVGAVSVVGLFVLFRVLYSSK